MSGGPRLSTDADGIGQKSCLRRCTYPASPSPVWPGSSFQLRAPPVRSSNADQSARRTRRWSLHLSWLHSLHEPLRASPIFMIERWVSASIISSKLAPCTMPDPYHAPFACGFGLARVRETAKCRTGNRMAMDERFPWVEFRPCSSVYCCRWTWPTSLSFQASVLSPTLASLVSGWVMFAVTSPTPPTPSWMR